MDHQGFAQLLGNYGEFVGAIAVVATLGYLAVQIRQNTSAMQASPRTYPLARWSNAKHSPSGESIDALLNPMLLLGTINALTPPAIAASHSPDQIERQAMLIATNADEHAVSTAILGPRKSN